MCCWQLAEFSLQLALLIYLFTYLASYLFIYLLYHTGKRAPLQRMLVIMRHHTSHDLKQKFNPFNPDSSVSIYL